MTAIPFTVLSDFARAEVLARIDGDAVRLGADALAASVGWTLEPQGLCKDGVCVPIGRRPDLVADGEVDLAGFARLLDRPLALDVDERAAALGDPAPADRTPLDAPDFALPDLAGRVHRLTDYRGRKVFLLAWASW